VKAQAVAIIPARFASVRLPGKPLIQLCGKPMIQWVYEKALQIPQVERVLVATDDHRILNEVRKFGGEAFLTPPGVTTGSERAGLVAGEIEAEIVVNLQGDEPLISPTAAGNAIQALIDDSRLKVSTLGFPIQSEEEWQNPSIVKIIVDHAMNAIYFSRAPLPYNRDDVFKPMPLLFRHIGVYVYRKSFLMDFLNWPEGLLESKEKLEQLRILERGYKIKVIQADRLSPGVDTPEDVPVVEKILKERGLVL
jgi:3-deoxy-manno-octulosonate cytidylyltransferase (CMP-KDO synthetase)